METKILQNLNIFGNFRQFFVNILSNFKDVCSLSSQVRKQDVHRDDKWFFQEMASAYRRFKGWSEIYVLSGKRLVSDTHYWRIWNNYRGDAVRVDIKEETRSCEPCVLDSQTPDTIREMDDKVSENSRSKFNRLHWSAICEAFQRVSDSWVVLALM